MKVDIRISCSFSHFSYKVAVDDPIGVKSGLWTGDIPPNRKPRTTGQLVVALLLSIVAVCYIPLQVLEGLRSGLIPLPFGKGHRTIPLNHTLAFDTCVVIWVLGSLLMTLLGFGSVCVLLEKLKRSNP